MYPQIFHIGRFFLPTYGLLVATGVLLGLWISVRNSARSGIDPEKAWNLGILTIRAKPLRSKRQVPSDALQHVARSRANAGGSG